MHTISRYSLAAAAVAALLPSAAVAATDSQLWTSAVVFVKLGPKWRLNQEVTVRFSDQRNGLYEVESNSLLGYALSPTVTVYAGYTHDPQYAAGRFTLVERRAREQVLVERLAHVAGGVVLGRFRLEQRWRDGLNGTAWRARPFLRYALPVSRKTRLVLSTEPFVNLSTTSFQRQPGLERVRNFAGVFVPLTRQVSLEAGYLNQYLFIRHGPDQSDHVASASLIGNF